MTHQQVKIVGTNGQLSLGKEFAGQMVLIDQIGEGTWVIKTGTFIPDAEKFLHKGKDAAKLDKAIAWAEKTKPSDNFDRFIQRNKK